MNSSSCKPGSIPGRHKAAPQPGPEFSGLTPDFPFAVAKVLQKTNTNQIFPQLFFKNFSQKSPKHHISAFYPSNFFMLYNIFSSIVTRSPLCREKIFNKRIIFAQITTCLKEHFNKSKTFCRTVRLKLTFPKFGIFQMLTNDIHAFKKKGGNPP